MAKRLDFDYRVFDNCIEIIPHEPITDNAIYEIRINGLKSKTDENKTLTKNIQIATKLSPCYCNPYAVKVILDEFGLSDIDILFFIRQASKQAEYINKGPIMLDADGNAPFVVEKYVELKATYDALTKAYVIGNNDAGMEGSIGDLTFKNGDSVANLKKLLDTLRRDIKKWQDAIQGYEFAGRAQSKVGLRANRTLRGTPANIILRDFSRNVNLGRDGIL